MLQKCANDKIVYRKTLPKQKDTKIRKYEMNFLQ